MRAVSAGAAVEMAASRPRLAVALRLLTILCYGVELAWSGCNNVTAMSVQLDATFSEYDREVAPEPFVRVLLALDVRHAALDDRTSTLRLLADLHLSWVDIRVAWNASDLGCDYGLVSADRLWQPDVMLVNAAAASAGDEPLRARVSSDGNVTWATRLDVSIPVAMKLDYWPNDVQTGVFKFASRAHTTDEIDLVVKDSLYAAVFEAGSWEIVELTGGRRLLAAEGGRARRVAAWTLALRRRAPAQALAARAALTAALLLLLAAALLPPATRPPLAAAAAFTTALWLCVSAGRVWGGAGAPRALSAAAGVCALSALGAVCAAGSARAAAAASPPPPALRAALAFVSRHCSVVPHAEAAGGKGGAWAAAARLLDAALLLALALALLIVLIVYL